jgi:hypothetical protein
MQTNYPDALQIKEFNNAFFRISEKFSQQGKAIRHSVARETGCAPQ